MGAVWLVGQALFVSALAYGCYLCMTNRHLSDKEGIEREFHGSSGLPATRRHDPLQDPEVAGEIGFLF
jgi:hypothetical protein